MAPLLVIIRPGRADPTRGRACRARHETSSHRLRSKVFRQTGDAGPAVCVCILFSYHALPIVQQDVLSRSAGHGQSFKFGVFSLSQLCFALCAGVCLLPRFRLLDCSMGHGEGFNYLKFDFFYKSADCQAVPLIYARINALWRDHQEYIADSTKRFKFTRLFHRSQASLDIPSCSFSAY